jgi:hypothetical protein
MPEVKRASDKVMDTPLPKILDDIEDAIKEAKLAAKESRDAAILAHEAAAVAKRAGEEAGLAARKAAEEAVAKVAKEAAMDIKAVRDLAMEALAVANATQALLLKTRKALIDAQNLFAEEI